MDPFKRIPSIAFMKRRKSAVVFSAGLILVALISLVVQGLNLGLDFTGGTLIEVSYPKSVNLSEVRHALGEGGYDEAVVQHFGTSQDVLVRVPPRAGVSSAAIGDSVLKLLNQASDAEVTMQRQEYVGPQVGGELRDDGGLAMLFALFGILLYVTVRFEYRFSLGAVAALIHDVVITVGFFSVFQFEFDLTVLAAVLAVIGYSLNDTIVVFDRIRENFRKLRKATPVEVVDVSLNQTLSRTLMTSFTTLLVLIMLFFFGGELIQSFALALIVGIGIGTYSSIYIASPIALALGLHRAHLMPVEKEGARQPSSLP